MRPWWTQPMVDAAMVDAANVDLPYLYIKPSTRATLCLHPHGQSTIMAVEASALDTLPATAHELLNTYLPLASSLRSCSYHPRH